MTQLTSQPDICVYNNLIPPEECESIIDMFRGCGMDANRPNVDSIMFTLNEYPHSPVDILTLRMVDKLLNRVDWKIGWLTYAKMYPGSSLIKHRDMVPIGDGAKGEPLADAVITLVMYLNGEYDGGELVIAHKLKHKPQKGDVVVFPGMDVEHEVLEVRGGPRHTITVWCIPNA